MKKLSPVIQWVGGKQRLLPELLKHIPKRFNRYYECFAGGLALMLALHPKHATINDFNDDLMTLYQQLATHYLSSEHVYLNYPKSVYTSSHQSNLHNLLLYLNGKNNKQSYMHIRNLDQHAVITKLSPIEIAARLCYLDKNGFNGIMRYSHTGYNHGKHENVPYGHHKKSSNLVTPWMHNVANYLHSIDLQIDCGDFAKSIQSAKAGDFIYADPPYLKRSKTFKSSFTGYTDKGFGISDQKRLAHIAIKMSKKHVYMMLSNADVPIIKELYPSKYFHVYHVDIQTLLASKNSSRKNVGEVIITNY